MINLIRRKRRARRTHPVYYGHVLPERIVAVVVAGACERCHEWVDDVEMPCPWCGDR